MHARGAGFPGERVAGRHARVRPPVRARVPLHDGAPPGAHGRRAGGPFARRVLPAASYRDQAQVPGRLRAGRRHVHHGRGARGLGERAAGGDRLTDAMPSHTAAFAPGRVNLIGEHTDYNDGLALPFAITEVGMVPGGPARHPWTITVEPADLGERDEFALVDPGYAPGWRAFVRGAVIELQSAGYALTGAELRISGDVPRRRGLSS